MDGARGAVGSEPGCQDGFGRLLLASLLSGLLDGLHELSELLRRLGVGAAASVLHQHSCEVLFVVVGHSDCLLRWTCV